MAGFCATDTPFTLFLVHFQYQEKHVFLNNLHLGAKITKANSKCKELQPLVRQTNPVSVFLCWQHSFFLFFPLQMGTDCCRDKFTAGTS